MALAARHGIELPIAAQMAAFSGRQSPKKAVAALMPGRSARRRSRSASFFHGSDGLAKAARRFATCCRIHRTSPEPANLASRTGRAVEVDTVSAVEEALIAADVGLPPPSELAAAIGRSAGLHRRARREEVRRVLTMPARRCPSLRGRTSSSSSASTAGAAVGFKLANFYRTSGRSVLVARRHVSSRSSGAAGRVAERAGTDLIVRSPERSGYSHVRRRKRRQRTGP
jgi:hypothetical protein